MSILKSFVFILSAAFCAALGGFADTGQTPIALVKAFATSTPVTGGYSGWAGMRITTTSSPITVVGIGRMTLSGNVNDHVLKIVSATTGADVANASTVVHLASATAGRFAYGTLATPVTLAPNTQYYIVSSESVASSGGDYFYNWNNQLTTTGAVTITGSTYWASWNVWHPLGNGSYSYGPLDLLYVPASTTGPTNPTVPTNGLRMWLKADSGVVQSGGAISQWSDQSGNSVNANQASAAAEPHLVASVLNGHPVVRFDGSSDFMTFPLNLNGMTGMSVFLVSSAASNAGGATNGVTNAPLFWGETAAWGATYFNPLQNWVGFRFGTGQVNNTAVYTRPSSIGTGAWITSAVKNSGTETLYVNGTQVLQQTGKLSAMAYISTTGYLGEGLSSSMFQGDIAEILIYNRAVAGTERQQIENYLMSKYGLGTPTSSGYPDLTVTVAHTTQFTAGATGTYSITVTNSGTKPTSGAVVAADSLPAGLSAASVSGSGWNCTVTPVSCMRSDALAASGSYPAISVTAAIATTVAASVTDAVSVSGGGESNTSNDSASDVATVMRAPTPDLTITSSHAGTFKQGDTADLYTITVNNVGSGSTSGTASVKDTVPGGMKGTAISGTGWTCSLDQLTCTRADALAAGANYPVIAITVSVSSSATSGTNTATVSGGGDANATNNVAYDATTVAPAIAASDETEFVGPFPSWTNVRTVYGARGDGSTDDTTAIQNGINALAAGSINVLYFPAGTYNVTQTLQMVGNRYLAMVGQDPTTTILKWNGAAGGDMLHVNGSAYSRVQRLTFDGSGTAGSGVNQGWDGTTANKKEAGEGNDYADLIIKDVQYGLRGGSAVACGSNSKSCDDADTEVLRVKFYRCSQACVSIESWNALNWQVFDSEFFDSRLGVTNEYGAGMYYVYNSVFHNSSYADLSVNMIGLFSVRGCTSIGSKKFLVAKSQAAGTGYTLQDNQVINPQDSEFIDFENMGALVMLDNKFQAHTGAVSPLVYHTSPTAGANDVSVGNTWNVANPISVVGPSPRFWALDDVTNSNLNLTAPTLPPFAPNLNRTIIEVPPGSSEAAIQNAINTAAASNNSTVVHLSGTYTLTSTLTVPGGTAVQIMGDSRRTTLTCSGITTAIQLQSPSRAVLGDFTIYCPGQTGIRVLGADQTGARVIADHFLASGPAQSLLAEDLDYTKVYLRTPQTYENSSVSDVLVNGGGAHDGHVLIIGGTSSNSNPSAPDMYHVENGGKLVVLDRWYEGSSPTVINWTGNTGTATFNGVILTPYMNTVGPSVDINSFSGDLSFINCVTQKTWSIGETSGTNVMMLGLNAYTVPWLTMSGSSGGVKLLESIQGVNAWAPANDIGSHDATYVRSMLGQLRGETPVMGLPTIPEEATDLQMYRLGVTSAAVALHVSR